MVKPKAKKRIPVDEKVKYLIQHRDRDNLEVRWINKDIGRGVFTLEHIPMQEPILVYRGTYGKGSIARKCSKKYVYSFEHEKEMHWCDASEEDDTHGRLVNDEINNPNCRMKKFVIDGNPYLILFSVKDIPPNNELRYNYGTSIVAPWRKKRGLTKHVVKSTEMAENLPLVPKENYLDPTVLEDVTTETTVNDPVKSSHPNCEGHSLHGILTAEMHQIRGDQNQNIPNTGLTENLTKNAEMAENYQGHSLHGTSTAEMHQNRGDQNQNIPNTGSTESSIESTEMAEYVQLTCHQENNYGHSVHGTSTADINQNGSDQNQNIQNTGSTENLMESTDVTEHLHFTRHEENNHGSTENLMENTEMAEYLQPTCHEENNCGSTENLMGNTEMAEYLQLMCHEENNCDNSLNATLQTEMNQDIQNTDLTMCEAVTSEKNRTETVKSNHDKCQDATSDFSDLDDSDIDETYAPSSNDGSVGSESDLDTNDEKEMYDLVTHPEQPEAVLDDVQATSDIEDEQILNKGQPQEISDDMEATRDNEEEQRRDKESSTCATPPTKYYENISVNRKDAGKIDYCLFCNAEYKSNISKHYISVHEKEDRVLHILANPLKSKRRKYLLLKLQNEGNFKHNAMVLKAKHGTLVVARRPKDRQGIHPRNYLPCEYCFGFYCKDLLWQHAQKCFFKPLLAPEVNYKRNAMMLLAPYTRVQTSDLGSFFGNMKETTENPGVANACESDELICEFAQSLLQRLGEPEEQRRGDVNNIRNKVRTVGRLLVFLNRNKDVPLPLSDYICGQKFKEVMEGAKGLSLKTQAPTIARDLGHYIKQVALLKGSMAIEHDNTVWRKEKDGFLEMYNAHWLNSVTSVSLRRMRLKALNKTVQLPLTSDLVKLQDHMQSAIKKLITATKLTIKQYQQLQEFLLVRITTFNKRRIREVEEVKVTDIDECPKDNEDIVSSLDMSEKVLAERMKVIEVRGKSTRKLRKVYILLTPDMSVAIERLVKERVEAGIPDSNPYLFARKSTNTPIDGCKAMQSVTDNCPGLIKPKAIRTRLLRQYLATQIQILNMTQAELRIIADHMGHNLDIHTDVYRLQSCLLEKTKVARVLLASDSGQLKNNKGKRIEEISGADLPAVPLSKNWGKDDDSSNDELNYEKEEDEMDMGHACTDEMDMGHACTDAISNKGKKASSVKKRPWSKEEKAALMEAFASNIKEKKNVGARAIRAAQEKYTILKRRTESQIRTMINNIVCGKIKVSVK